MNKSKIYRYAYLKAVDIWASERKHLDEMPENEVAKIREANAWSDMEYIGKKLYKLERKEKQ